MIMRCGVVAALLTMMVASISACGPTSADRSNPLSCERRAPPKDVHLCVSVDGLNTLEMDLLIDNSSTVSDSDEAAILDRLLAQPEIPAGEFVLMLSTGDDLKPQVLEVDVYASVESLSSERLAPEISVECETSCPAPFSMTSAGRGWAEISTPDILPGRVVVLTGFFETVTSVSVLSWAFVVAA
jgi:hypothetical protein